jgi:hypothetical protein
MLIDRSNTEIERLNNIIHSKINEIDSIRIYSKGLESKVTNYEQQGDKKLVQYEEKISHFTIENDRLNQVLKGRLADL